MNETVCLLPDGGSLRNGVPVFYFQIAALPGGEIVGRCDLRAGHNAETDIGGNIGYAVFPQYRGHGYALQACRLLLEMAARQGMSRVGICCERENTASRKTCERLGAVFCGEITVPEDHTLYAAGKRTLLRYECRLPNNEP